MAGEAAAGIVLLDRHLGAGNACVFRLDVEARGGARTLADLAEIADRSGVKGGDCGT